MTVRQVQARRAQAGMTVHLALVHQAGLAQATVHLAQAGTVVQAVPTAVAHQAGIKYVDVKLYFGRVHIDPFDYVILHVR